MQLVGMDEVLGVVVVVVILGDGLSISITANFKVRCSFVPRRQHRKRGTPFLSTIMAKSNRPEDGIGDANRL